MRGYGSLIISQKTDQVGTDGGATGAIEYITVWGEPKNAIYELDAVTTDAAVVVYDAETGLIPVRDFWRERDVALDAILAGDEILLGEPDWTTLTPTVGTNIYAVIPATMWTTVKTHFCAVGSGYGRSFIGFVKAQFPSVADVLSVNITFQPYGAPFAFTHTVDVYIADLEDQLNCELEPLSEVIETINDQNVAHAKADIQVHLIDVR